MKLQDAGGATWGAHSRRTWRAAFSRVAGMSKTALGATRGSGGHGHFLHGAKTDTARRKHILARRDCVRRYGVSDCIAW